MTIIEKKNARKIKKEKKKEKERRLRNIIFKI